MTVVACNTENSPRQQHRQADRLNTEAPKNGEHTGWHIKLGATFVLQLVSLEVLIRLAPNLAQINVISFLTLDGNLFEIIFGKPSGAIQRLTTAT